MQKTNFLLLFVLLFFSAPFIKGQMHYLDDYEGIPIVAVYINADAQDLTTLNFQRLRELGAIGISSRIHDDAEYNKIKNNGMRVIPINIWDSGPNQSSVTYYSDAIYTMWEAEGHLGDSLNKGAVELKYDSQLGEVFSEQNSADTIKGIVTKSSNAGELIYGPAYAQYIKYKVLPLESTTDIIKYNARFRLKIKQIGSLPPLDDYLDSPVCTIEVVASNPKVNPTTYLNIRSKILTVRDFIEGGDGGWNVWQDKVLANYSLEELADKSEEYLRGIDTTSHDPSFDSMWMQFVVDWAGSNFLKLYVDYVEVSDEKGRRLKTDSSARQDVYDLVALYSDPTYVLGWMGLNEPGTIDNFEPIRIVDSLIQAATNGNLRYYATFTSGWKGLVGYYQPGLIPSNGYVLTSLEFLRRTKLPYISYNLYNYLLPFRSAAGQ